MARKSRRPSSRWRRLRARCTASLRAKGWTVRCRAASSSLPRCMKSTSSGKRAPERLGDDLGPAVGDEPAADFRLDLFAHALVARR